MRPNYNHVKKPFVELGYVVGTFPRNDDYTLIKQVYKQGNECYCSSLLFLNEKEIVAAYEPSLGSMAHEP